MKKIYTLLIISFSSLVGFAEKYTPAEYDFSNLANLYASIDRQALREGISQEEREHLSLTTLADPLITAIRKKYKRRTSGPTPKEFLEYLERHMSGRSLRELLDEQKKNKTN